ncbi:zinc-finger double domain-containing protein [Phthorimaea operculella]|nr:zinc-finger double domain-containing protein [Phthorimaea operculella]
MSCVLCSLSLDLDEFETRTIKWKGIQTIIQCSIERKDNVADSLRNVDSVTVHLLCRKSYTRRKNNGKLNTFHPPKPSEPNSSTGVKFEYITIFVRKNEVVVKNQTISNAAKYPDSSNSDCTDSKSAKNTTEHGTEIKYFLESDNKNNISNEGSDKPSGSESYLEQTPDCEQTLAEDEDPSKPFPFQHKCLFCAKEINEKAETKKSYASRKKNLYSTISKAQSKDIIITALKKNPTTTNMRVLRRIQDTDLVQENARYHRRCYDAVTGLRDIPMEGTKKKTGKNVGRPECPLILAAVNKVCRYIDESNRTEFTTTELKNTVTSEDYQPCWRTIETKLLKKYDGKIYFTRVSGRSTIVTVAKGPGFGGSTVIPPWNLNSTELGGLTEEVEVLKNKRKYNMTNKELAIKGKRKQMKKTNNTINIKENKCDKESIKEPTSKNIITEYDDDDDNDYIDDTYNSGEYAADDKTNVLCCQVCLSSDRTLEDLGNYSDILRQIGSNIFINHFEPKVFLICWECIALLKNVKRFQRKIMIAQKLWNTEVQEPPKPLSSLSITTPSTASVSYIDEKQPIGVKPEIVTVDDFPQEEQLIEDEKPVVEEINIHYDTFDDDTKNVEIDVKNIDDDTFNYDTKDYEVRTRPKLRRKKAQAKRKKCIDSDQDLDVPFKPSYQPKIRKSSSEDPDWEATVKEKDKSEKGKAKSHQDKNNTIKLKIPYTMIVQTYITETKMKRQPIEPHELQYWLDTEINSDHFKNLEQKCLKCISEVPENHFAMCHSAENPYVCDICESTFARNDEKESHVASHYYVFSCEFCGYKCYNETHMRGHVETHRRLVQCLECFAAFETFDTLKEHFNNLHRYAECDYCGKQFAHKRTVATHIERCHTPQICTICNTSYSSYSHKKHHMNLKHRIERTEAAYCVQCDIQFDNVALLKRHVYHNVRHKHEWKRDHAKKAKEQHKCPECPNVYAQKHTMKGHYNLVHAKNITFYCNYCNKPFPTKNNYKNHMRAKHEGYELPKNKFCHICGRGFSTNRILVNHIRTHTGERPFACPHCASSFAQKAALRSHVAHVHEKRQRTAGEACTKRRQSNAPPTFIDSALGLI